MCALFNTQHILNKQTAGYSVESIKTANEQSSKPQLRFQRKQLLWFRFYETWCRATYGEQQTLFSTLGVSAELVMVHVLPKKRYLHNEMAAC